MIQYLEKYKQNIAIEMRKKGLSYSEIGNKINIPKSTLSFWLKKIKLTPEQLKKLNDKKIQTAKTNASKKKYKTQKAIEEITYLSLKDIKEISKKELWLMGIILYWKNGNKNDLKKGVYFSSSNPHMIQLFLNWLLKIGGIPKEEIKFNIFLKNKKQKTALEYWLKITGFPKDNFDTTYFQNGLKNKGFLRIKVTRSSMLARQIAGWIEGLKNINNLL